MVGALTLAWEGLELPGDAGQALIAFTAEPGSPSADALGFLRQLGIHGLRHETPPTPVEPGQ